MDTQVVIELPEDVYHELTGIAEASKSTLAEVVLQSVRCGMPPSLGKVPKDFHADLLILNGLPDQDLMRIVEGDWPPSQKKSELYKKANFEALRRTYALSLLRWRGHPIPTPYEI